MLVARALFLLALASLFSIVTPALADNWATQVVSYDPGTNPASGYTNSAAALGEPTRFTGVGVFPGAVTPFNPPFLNTEIVSLGTGGSLVVGEQSPEALGRSRPVKVHITVEAQRPACGLGPVLPLRWAIPGRLTNPEVTRASPAR